jgi:hypothetical protein
MAPIVAPAPSRFSAIALSGITIDRNIASSSKKLVPSRKATTIQARDSSRSMPSIETAWSPVTYAVAGACHFGCLRFHLRSTNIRLSPTSQSSWAGT